MPVSDSLRALAERCHWTHSSWNRAWATPAQSEPSGATADASCASVPSTLDAPAASCEETCESCSGVTLMFGILHLLSPGPITDSTAPMLLLPFIRRIKNKFRPGGRARE